MTKKKMLIGLIVNPWAGVGGEVALKGSDGQAIREQALSMGAELKSEVKVSKFLEKLQGFESELSFLSCPSFMGENVLKVCDFEYQLIQTSHQVRGLTTTNLPVCSAADTEEASRKMAESSVDLLIFAGGDGTARDVAKGLIQYPKQLCLGIPTGVKIQSGVFARSPEFAAALLIAMTEQVGIDVCVAEVRDIDEEALRQGRLESRFFSELKVPSLPDKGLGIQGSKQGKSQLSEFALEEELLIAEEIAVCLKERFELERAHQDLLLIVGAGKTTQAFKRLWIEGEDKNHEETLLGVDVFFNGTCLKYDASEADILTLFMEHPEYLTCCRVVVSVIGGQGFIFGRGSQPISAKVLEAVLDTNGREAIVVLASQNKITALQTNSLFVDTGDSFIDSRLSGRQLVLINYEQEMLCQVGH